ncbi:MAG TPA: VWA domain-containing protein [Candidatus Polarisedimenticolia bacterium]|nr:VWA domain-containing protein [Candidatus Polarisedimenticolia bacterium]
MTASTRLLLPVVAGLCLPALLLGTPAGETTEDPAFSVRIISPSPLFLVGHCHIQAAAFDRAGQPKEKLAYMALTIDGRGLEPDSKAPYEWELDVDDDLRRHTIEVVAVDGSGRRATLSVVSSGYTYTESVSVDLVLVPVVVRDASGRLVRDLKAADFTVSEGGQPRPIVSFTTEPIPASIVVALDNSRSMEGRLWSAQRAVIDFLKARPVHSAASLLTFNDQVFLERDFTHERDALAGAVGAVRVEGSRTALYDAVKTSCRHLSRRPGSRVLVLFTDGEETVYEGEAGRLTTAIEAAQAADVTVYAVAYAGAARGSAAASLGRLARETGGEVVVAGASDLGAAFGRLAEAIDARYLLGYEPVGTGAGGYRDIEVRVSRDGAVVFARRGYTTPSR